MIYKQTSLNHKSWADAGAVVPMPGGLFAKLLSKVKVQIPVGYQDEGGFHYGAKSVEKEVKWPSVW